MLSYTGENQGKITIGDGAVIAADVMATKDVLENTVAGGVSVKIIKKLKK